MAESHSAAGLGESASLGGPGVPGSESESRRRPLSELRVIDLRAELRHRNLDSGGNKSVLMERLRKVRAGGRTGAASGVGCSGCDRGPAGTAEENGAKERRGRGWSRGRFRRARQDQCERSVPGEAGPAPGRARLAL